MASTNTHQVTKGIVISLLLISGLLMMAVAVTSTRADKDPSFNITTRRDSDQVIAKAEHDKVTFSVHSPFGISNATIERVDERWPDVVVLCLHLRGLEHFSLSNDTMKLDASVSSQDGSLRLWKDGREDTPLDAKTPYRMEIRMFGSDGKPTTRTPLQNGHFELQLPKAFFERNPKSITLNWIDFYRN